MESNLLFLPKLPIVRSMQATSANLLHLSYSTVIFRHYWKPHPLKVNVQFPISG